MQASYRQVVRPSETTYYWERFTFFCKWRAPGQSDMLCFLPADSIDDFAKFASANLFDATTASPFGAQIKVFEYVISRFDHAVWQWRDLVRDCESNRLEPDTLESDWITDMHEAARHVIHICEMVQMALQVTGSLLDEVTTISSRKGSLETVDTSATGTLKYLTSVLQCILLRSQALEKRIQNELQLACTPQYLSGQSLTDRAPW
jgi:hypothetical protein